MFQLNILNFEKFLCCKKCIIKEENDEDKSSDNVEFADNVIGTTN